MDERSFSAGSVLHIADTDGRVDVPHFVDRNAQHTAESAGKDDELHHAGDVHAVFVQGSSRTQSLLRDAEPGDIAPAMASVANAWHEQAKDCCCYQGRGSHATEEKGKELGPIFRSFPMMAGVSAR